MKNRIDVSIIIVSYNTKDLLSVCLSSLIKQKGSKSWEIIVVDNASSDGTSGLIKEKFPDVIFIQNKKNVGFSTANNIGLRRARGKYFLLLNSDTEVSEGAIGQVWQFMEKHTDVGVATCKLVLRDGSIDPACHRGFPTPWASLTFFLGLEKLFPRSRLFAQYHLGFKDMNEPHEIDSPSGAFYMVRREVIESVGFLDEDYFMYAEDLDWSYRIKQAGWKIFYYPEVSALHKKKQSGRNSDDPSLRKITETYFYDTMKLFYKKHYQHRYGWLVTNLVQLGIRLQASYS